jgi:hemoglobin-like flavoprotein
LAPRADRIGNYFYARLFHTEPGLRALFAGQMREQNDHFVQVLLHLAEGSAEPDRLTMYLRRLGVGHRRYRVQPEHYPVVGVSLIAALKFLSGPVWTLGWLRRGSRSIPQRPTP